MSNLLHLTKFRLSALLVIAGLSMLVSGCPVCSCEPDRNYVAPFDVDSATLALWHFDEGTGQQVLDKSSNGNNLVLGANNTVEVIDPAWSNSGKFGQSLAFDATGQYAYLPSILNAFPGGQLTVEFWVKINNSGVTQEIITTGNSIFNFQVNSSNFAVFTLSDGMALFTLIGTTNIADNNWHYVAGVFDGITATAVLYIDGLQQARINNINITLPDPSDYYIGSIGGGITGNIDEVRLSSIARTESEIFNYFVPY